jgi:hypothetical protein
MRSAALLFCMVQVFAQVRPQPPCGMDPAPAYPALESPPAVKFWSESEFGRDWKPPACTGWQTTGFMTLTATAGRFRFAGRTDDLLRHIGAISETARIRYWSTTHQQWLTLILEAQALSGPQPDQHRADFKPDELRPGRILYFEQTDNLTGRGLYRLRITEASVNRIVYDIENTNTMRYFFLTTFHPADLQTVCFLDQESEGVWTYYSIVRTGRNASRLTSGHEASSINRAVAFYRHLAGIRTDEEPPAAR